MEPIEITDEEADDGEIVLTDVKKRKKIDKASRASHEFEQLLGINVVAGGKDLVDEDQRLSSYSELSMITLLLRPDSQLAPSVSVHQTNPS